VLKVAALEVYLKLLLNILRQDHTLRRKVSVEGGIVFKDLKGALPAMVRVNRRAATQTGFPGDK
jgi:hypothetical protein